MKLTDDLKTIWALRDKLYRLSTDLHSAQISLMQAQLDQYRLTNTILNELGSTVSQYEFVDLWNARLLRDSEEDHKIILGRIAELEEQLRNLHHE